MNKIVSLYILAFLAIAFSCTLVAQENVPKHEFSVWAAGGLSTLKYKPTIGSQKNGLGGQVGLGYTYFITPQWGVNSGAELSFHKAKTKLDGLSGNYDTKDYENTIFNFRYRINQYEDTQTAMFINIPLMLQYQTLGRRQFYIAAGGKIGIPISQKSKINKYNIQTSGYYSTENYEYTDEHYMGFGEFSGKKDKTDIDIKVSYMLSAEAGLKWKIGKQGSLYTGAYLDYGLNNINKTTANKEQLLAYNASNPTDYEINSIIVVKQNKELVVKKINQLSTGIKVRYSFGIGASKRKIESKIVEIREPEIKPIIQKKEEKTIIEKPLEIEKETIEEPTVSEDTKKDLEDLEALISGFPINVTQLNKKQKLELDEKIKILKKHSNWEIDLVGYTCDIGSQEINNRIAKQRAEAVEQYFVANGIQASRINISGQGKQDYVTSNINEDARLLNRRVAIRAKNFK